MNQEKEAILGQFSAIARLGIGSESLRLFLTDRRLIVAHVRKTGLGALAAMPLLGKLSLGLMRSGERSSGRPKTEQSPEQILGLDKDNFYLNYTDIIKVELDELIRTTRVMLLTKDDKLEFFATTGFDSIVKLFANTLGEKVISRSLGESVDL